MPHSWPVWKMCRFWSGRLTDEEMLELALVENIHRADLNPIERAKAYQNYINSFNITQTEAAQRLGEDRTVISNYLRILDLPKDIKDMFIGWSVEHGPCTSHFGAADRRG